MLKSTRAILKSLIFSRFFAAGLLMLLCVSCSVLQSQPKEWISVFGNNRYNYISTVTADIEGNVLISGLGQGYLPVLNRQYPLLIKFDNNGTFKWLRTYPVQGISRSHTTDINGNIYILTAFPQFDVGIIKYNTTGDTLWSRIFTGETPIKIISDNGKFIYACARKRNPVTLGFDFYAIKLDTAGNLIWDMRVDSIHNSTEQPHDMALDRSGNIFITGSSSQGTERSFTVKIDSSGELVWESLHQTGNFDCPSFSIVLDSLGNSYAAGYSLRSKGGGTTYSYKVIKYTPTGVIAWEKEPVWGVTNEVRVDNSNNCYLSGSEGLVKLNSDGDLIRYDRTRKGTILLDISDNVFLFRTILDSLGLNSKHETFKIDSTGNVIWLKSIYLQPNYTFGNGDVFIDNSSVYIGKSKSLNPGNDSILIVKYSQQLISVEPIGSLIPKEFSLSQNYPNPFNPLSKFKFQISKPTNVSIKIFDLLGREIFVIVNKFLKAGVYEAEINGSELPSGVYFYSLFIENRLFETRKMVLIK